MAAKLVVSTGHAKYLHGIGSVIKAYTGGRIDVYGGAAAPATADAAAAGTKLYSITNNAKVPGVDAKAKQKIRITPTPGSAAAAEWNVTLNGVKATFIDDGTPTAAEICTGLYNLIRAMIGTVSITTPAGKINIPDVNVVVVLTDNAGTLDVEAAVAGVPFKLELSVSGAGAGTGALAMTTLTEDSYGLQFEEPADITVGILEKSASQTWAGKVVADGTPTYFRVVTDADTGTSSTTLPRSQGAISTVAGAAMEISHSSVKVGETVFVDSASFIIPLT